MSEDEVLYNKKMQKSISDTKDICSIISCSSKFDIICKCLCLPYKVKEDHANIDGIKVKCLYGQFNACGFSRVC